LASQAIAGETPGEAGEPLPAAERADSAWAILQADGEHEQFLRLAHSVGLYDILDGEHAITVFAPTDAAFDALEEQERQTLEATWAKPRLRRLLGGHLLWATTLRADVGPIMLRSSMAGLTVRLEDDAAQEGLFQVNSIEVATADLVASNGVIHQVDQLILTPAEARDARASRDDLQHAPACSSRTGSGGDTAGHGGHNHRGPGASGAGGSDGTSGPRGLPAVGGAGVAKRPGSGGFGGDETVDDPNRQPTGHARPVVPQGCCGV
jgi:uncharacterized surface protein with fasciclin (FAS1) repeats